jgi:biotin carboxylase
VSSAASGQGAAPAEPEPPARPLLVVVNSLSQVMREYLLRSIARHFGVWLLQDSEPTWETPYLTGHTVVDTLDSAAMVSATAGLPVAGVLCWDEVRVEAAAALAHKLGLPGSDPDAVHRCRDKQLTRAALAAAGVPQPASLPAAGLAGARAAAARIGYPVVIKPRALAGSFGVVKVAAPGALADAFALAAGSTLAGVPRYHGVLVEEYAAGDEISVDAVCRDGAVTPVFTARKQLGFPPYFEETGHAVRAGDPLLASPRMRRLLTVAHAAVGMTTGWTHTEFRLTAGGPKLVEINARLGGDMIPYLGMLATGIDPGLAAAAVSCGLPPALSPRRSGAAAIRFVYPPRDMVIAEVEVSAARLVPGVDTVTVLARPGQELLLPPRGHITGRAAYVIAAGATAAECAATLDTAAAEIEVRGAGPGRGPS